jgi:MoxR-like ATPase
MYRSPNVAQYAHKDSGEETNMLEWKIFEKNKEPHDGIERLPEAPPWRQFRGVIDRERRLPKTPEEARELNVRGATFESDDKMVEMVNASLYLRRPLLLTGKPGSGKSSLIYAVARQLKLGEVLRWPITSRSNLRDALYTYDALGRLHEQQLGSERKEENSVETRIGDFLELGPLGTALLPTNRPRALLIDEIDKSDIDLPNDLLNALEEGEFHIPELARLKEQLVEVRAFGGNEKFPIRGGHVRCKEFPFVVMTSNGEREFPAPFLRRCLRLTMPEPDATLLERIVSKHLGPDIAANSKEMISAFAERSRGTALATDQLLNAVFIVTRQGTELVGDERERVLAALQKELASPTQ